MTRTLAAAALALSCAGHALAAIIHTNVSPGDVYTNTMMLDWYDGLEERYDAAGVEWEDLTQAYKVYAGETTATEVVTNDLGDVLYTNEAPYSVYASSVRTNRDCFLPWVTTHTNAGTVTVTNVPLVTASIVSELDDRTMDITDEYIQLGLTNSAGDYSEWFGTFVTNDGGDRFYPPSVPDACPASVMIAAEIGFTTNLLTNIWGAVTDGEAYFTRHPLTTQDWALAEAYYTCVDGTNGWYFRSLETFDKRYYSSTPPAVRYWPSGTNAYSSCDVTIQGTVLVQANQSTVSTSETVTVSTSNGVSCSLMWYNVTNMTATNGPANTGDVFAVTYDGAVVLYGDLPYRLYAVDLEERYKYIDQLRWMYQTPSFSTGVCYEGYGDEYYTYWYKSNETYYGSAPPTKLTALWAGLKSKGESEFPTGLDSFGAYAVLCGKWETIFLYGPDRIGETYYLSAKASMAIYDVSSLATTIAHQVDFYSLSGEAWDMPYPWEVLVSDYTTNVFNDQGWGYTQGEYVVEHTSSESYSNSVPTPWVGGTNWPLSTVCPSDVGCTTQWWEYYVEGETIEGISLTVPHAVIKWDQSTNGFQKVLP